jgi:chromosome segregation ATPase
MKSILYLVFMLLVGWVIYVSFFGQKNDLELRDKLLSTGKAFGESVIDVFKNETDKISNKDYQELMKKLDQSVAQLKEADQEQNQYQKEISEIELRKKEISDQIDHSQEEISSSQKEKLKNLAEDIVSLSSQMSDKK